MSQTLSLARKSLLFHFQCGCHVECQSDADPLQETYTVLQKHRCRDHEEAELFDAVSLELGTTYSTGPEPIWPAVSYGDSGS